MNNKTERLIKLCSTIEPLEGRILVQPLKIRTYKANQIVLDDEKNIDKDPLKDDMEVKTIEETINRRFQKAIVLQVPYGESRFDIGNTIVYSVGGLQEFDLFKGVSVLKKYDVVAILK